MKKVFKWIGIVSGGVMTIVLLTYAFIYSSISRRIEKRYAFADESILIPNDSATLARGAHLAAIKGCTDCHGDNMAGKVMMNDGGLGTLVATNLTKGTGGLPQDYSIKDWMRSLRHGVSRQGNPLLLMPSHESTLLNEKDLAAIIAYCQQLQSVNNELPPTAIGPVVRIMTFLDKMPLLSVERIDHNSPVNTTIATNMIAEGKYLAISCKGCHRDNMQDGDPMAPGMPAVPNITSAGPVANGPFSNLQPCCVPAPGRMVLK
jgi:cytochrome c553